MAMKVIRLLKYLKYQFASGRVGAKLYQTERKSAVSRVFRFAKKGIKLI